MKLFFSSFFFLFLTCYLNAQVVYEDVNHTGIYEFLDELANLDVIEVHSVIKPWSRHYIAGKLREAEKYDEAQRREAVRDQAKGRPSYVLTDRQRRELAFYLQDYQLERGESRGGDGRDGCDNRDGRDGTRKGEVPGIVDDSAGGDLDFRYRIGMLSSVNQEMTVALQPFGFHYRDGLFTLSVRPILGVSYMVNGNGDVYHRYWGGSLFSYVGGHFGFYANLRDNNESEPLALPKYFTQRQGAVYKYRSDKTADYSEMRGGINVSWKWGSMGLMKDRPVWGNSYNGSNILSGKIPSVPYLQLVIYPVKWFRFNYIHAWLNSNVVDSSRSYYDGDIYREIYRSKCYAANMFTFIPWKGLDLSVGNSIVYGDNGVKPVFLIPFLFFNSVDATGSAYQNDAGQNSQIFFDISSRQIRHLHLYATLFIDELMMSRVTDPGKLNWTSWKAGFRLSGFPLRNVTVTGEWTKTNPITYKHYIATTTFSSNDYCMGHYLRDNSMELYAAVTWKPLRGLSFTGEYTMAEHGDEYPDDRSYSYDNLRFMENVTWKDQSVGVTARYEYASNGFFFVRYLYSKQEGEKGYQPGFMQGTTHTFSTGINLGF